MRRLWAVALLLGAACTGDAAASRQEGTLSLTLVGGAGNDGAVVMVVSGGPISAVDAPAGYQVATNVDGAATHIMVVGTLAPGTIASIHVPDVAQAQAYVATVVQVADRTSFALLDPLRYQVVIGK